MIMVKMAVDDIGDNLFVPKYKKRNRKEKREHREEKTKKYHS